MDVPVLADQQRYICNTSARTQDAVKRTVQERWTIGTYEEIEREIERERERERDVLVA